MTWLLIPIGIVATFAAVIVYRQLRPGPAPSLLWWYMDNPITRRVAGNDLTDQLALMPGMRVLDAGCGPGRLTIPMAKAVGPSGQVAALDLSESMLKRVQSRAEAEGLTNVAIMQSPLGKGALPREHFDRAVMVSVIGEIPKDARDPALREVLTSLKPGAYLLVAECLDDPDYQRTKAVRALLTGCGFEIDSTQKATFGYRVKASRPNSAAHVAQATSAEPTIAR